MTIKLSSKSYIMDGEEVYLGITTYESTGNVALVEMSDDGVNYEEAISRNVIPLSKNLFLADVNNIPNVEDFLKSNNIAVPTGAKVKSGFVTYPVYELTAEFLSSIEE